MVDLPVPPVKQLTAGLLRIKKRYSVYLEHGTTTWFLVYTLSGKGRFGHSNGELTVEVGDMVLIRPNTPHDYGVESRLRRWDLLWVHFIPPPDWFSLLEWPTEAPGLMRLSFSDSKMRRKVTKQFIQVHHLATLQTQKHELLAMLALEGILVECRFLNQQVSETALDSRIQQALDILSLNLSDTISMSSLAKRCGLSLFHFMHLFKKQTGDTPQHLLETQRMKHACYLLEFSQQPVSQVAQECGFQDQLYFSRRFKRMTGVAPLAYRKKNARPPGLVHDFSKGLKMAPSADLLLERQARQRAEEQEKKLLGRARTEAKREWRLVHGEDLADSHVTDRWEFIGGQWEIRNGELRRWGGANHFTHFRQPVFGDIRIEFDCHLESDRLSDISCFLSAQPLPDKKKICETGYMFQYGGEGNTKNFIERPGKRLGVHEATPLVRGQIYHVRAERCGAHLVFTVNGQIVIDVEDDEPLAGMNRTMIGLYGWRSDAWYRNIRIYQRGAPLKVDPLELAEQEITLGYYDAARQIFQDVAGSSKDPVRRDRASKGLQHVELRMEMEKQLISIETRLHNLWPKAEIERIHHQLKIIVNDCDIRDLTPLRNLPIVRLDCAGNQIESLEFLRDMPLQTLHCSRNSVRDLSPLQGLPLRTLFCNQNQLKDLESLRGMRLGFLSCQGNRIENLESLRGMFLGQLHCDDNLIKDLDPLRGMKLEDLICGRNRITTLLPLAGMPLASLYCEANCLTSLEPFVENPPPVFIFDNDTLPSEELKRLIGIWRVNPKHAHHARNVEVLLAIRQKNFDKLRTLASSFQERQYLFIPKPMEWTAAREFCEKLGGHLLTLTSEEEENFIANMQPVALPSMWLGLVVSQGRGIWISGESSEFTRLPPFQKLDGPCRITTGSWNVNTIVSVHRPIPFIVEWPN